MGTSREEATSAPSTGDIHLRVLFCLSRSISAITSMLHDLELELKMPFIQSLGPDSTATGGTGIWWLWSGASTRWRCCLAKENYDIDEETPWNLQAASTIIFITFWDFLMFYQIFHSPQVKRSAIIIHKHGIYKIPHELPNHLRGWGLCPHKQKRATTLGN